MSISKGIVAILAIGVLLYGCQGRAITSGDPEYEARTITIEGLRGLEGGIAQVSVAELRALPQYELDASYKRTTGLTEHFKMSGPRLLDVIAKAGGNLDDYAGMGVIGRDNYYCLFSREVLDSTPDLLLALVIDGEAKLDEDNAPARAAVPGQFGPYWVRQVSKLILYDEIPQKNITSAWVFESLAAGIEPTPYEYYGSEDGAIELGLLFSRLDNVDSRAFLTMKSVDGFTKNEAYSMVKSSYYIKIDGDDAPTNVAGHIRLGMNVQRIAWFSTNADAVFFPLLLMEYMDTAQVRGRSGVPVDELLYEVGFGTVKAAEFDLLGVGGERVRVPGSDLGGAILSPNGDGGGGGGGGSILWEPGYDYPDIDDLMRVRLVTPTSP